jgi:hypothetical protein
MPQCRGRCAGNNHDSHEPKPASTSPCPRLVRRHDLSSARCTRLRLDGRQRRVGSSSELAKLMAIKVTITDLL